MSGRPPVVLVAIGSLGRGGAEGHLLRVAPRLRARDLDVRLCVLRKGGSLEAEFGRAGVPVHLPARADEGLLARIRHFVRTKRALSPAVVHFFLPEAYLIGGVESFLDASSARVLSRRSLNDYHRAHPWLSRVERRLHRRMSVVLGNSLAVIEQLRAEGVPPDRLALIYGGIEALAAEVRSPRPAGQEAALVIACVANLIPYKGHSDLLRGLAAVRDRLPSGWTALMIGRDEGGGRELAELARALGVAANVRWLGERADVGELLASSDLAVLASHQEGFSNAILEAMRASLPVVATDVGGNREAVVHGTTGFLVPARDPGALGERVAELAERADVRAAMGRAARERILARFTLDDCAERYALLYRHLIDRPRDPVPVELRPAGDRH